MRVCGDKDAGTLMFTSPRPNFLHPPVVEVVLSAQFEEIPSLGTAQIGSLWERFRSEFPRTEDKARLATMIERFDRSATPQAGLTITSVPHVSRCWFISHSGNELIQVQPNRFIFNWRRSDNEQPYPRYEKVRARFSEFFSTFIAHISGMQETVVPNQCEVTYVNHIYASDEWSQLGNLAPVFSFWSGEYSDDFLRPPEDVRLHLRHLITGNDGKPIGRLVVECEPRTSMRRNELLRLTLTARGAPFSPDTDGILAFFDLGREYVVRGFTSMTTKCSHQVWGRTDG